MMESCIFWSLICDRVQCVMEYSEKVADKDCMEKVTKAYEYGTIIQRIDHSTILNHMVRIIIDRNIRDRDYAQYNINHRLSGR